MDADDRRTVVIGVGNPDRGDDAAGLLTARALGARDLQGVRVLERSGEATGILEAWEGARLAVLIDAVATGAEIGAIHRVDPAADPLPAPLRTSTHAFGVAEAVELGRALAELPPRLVLYGIEAARFSPGEPPSPEVEAAVGEVAERVAQELEEE